MLEEYEQELQGYFVKWEELVTNRIDRQFFEDLKPVAIGWKVADEADYKQMYDEVRDRCDRIVETWMNGRWIAKMHLKDSELQSGITIIKLMQRRPGSDDALGLDHVDFYSPAVEHAETVLAQETDLKWTNESNDAVQGYGWISIWFDGGEAKLKAGTVIDIVVKELQEINATLKA